MRLRAAAVEPTASILPSRIYIDMQENRAYRPWMQRFFVIGAGGP
jgi:hypothetical protein